MNATESGWLREFADAAERSDRLVGSGEHAKLLAAGLMGEAGSVVAELKKERRERDAYPVYRRAMHEEVGDFLWYFVRLCDVATPGTLDSIQTPAYVAREDVSPSLALFLEFGSAVGDVLRSVADQTSVASDLQPLLEGVWDLLGRVAGDANVDLREAAKRNTLKTASRWPGPGERTRVGLFDEELPEEEQLPRRLEIEFRERPIGDHKSVVLRCNDINFGDRLTDNIEDSDFYRYHDIFHFAHAAYLGWSPVVRALLRCKRKSLPKKDEGQDGARAVILEEAATATIFSRAKELGFFDGIDHVDYDLLKTVHEFVSGFEVDVVPLWQWEEAILKGYEVFRRLRDNRGGRVTLDLRRRELHYVAV